MVTIKMIAKECGYSVATVSKALNDAADISAETRDRIRAVAADMGYTRNAAARMLKTGRSYSFGVLFEDQGNRGLTHLFFSQILNSFKHRSEELGYDISFITEHLGGREISFVEHARYRNCDGVIIAAVDCTRHSVVDLVNSGIPVVTIDYSFGNCTSVISDNLKGMADLVNYVYRMGHRRIAYIYGDDTAVTRQRVASFCRTCQALGVEVPEEYLVPSLYCNAREAEAATKKLLDLPQPPTCILYSDDLSQLGAWNEFERRGMCVPEDISIAGYDGVEVGQMRRPRLTTVKQDAQAIGILAAEELAKAVEEGRSYIPKRLLVPGKLLPGQTVKDITVK